MECRLPESVVFLQDNNHQVFKDICMDGEECSLENCELNHNNIYYMLKYELDHNAELENRVLHVSESKPESFEGTVKHFDDSKKLLMEGKADTGAEVEIAGAISFYHPLPKEQSLDGELVDNKYNQDQEMNKEACSDQSNIPDSIFREGSNSNDKKSSNIEDGTPMRSLASLFASQNTEKLPDREDSNVMMVSASKQCNDNISVRSSSTNSTKSFAFPVLTSEWTGSPAKMVEAGRRDFKRRSCWRMCF
ncbi:uncharacterized protein LOC107812525 [Nicotiana tabacum]|uniref:Protein BREAKING OF ASYMMETRY IN THE STOMATAL LINEAGE-like n=3 Tax=Nicotiana TaxID=4085 RepID=A0A1S4BW80_TOBAC|nr:PREDICTED: uncharacterized protein LOC104240266 [Nicotiana sylvestris]XP_009793380.1 PREDICTED: uncharacterized protein LOC104240266 [Nicotiana sylvestris]XP_009793381.1 PREDICTED: uncharacterized protein LOC104240266 [Nicotiana sylvestris]XP_016493140.1 PREDICTED: uncharacterized protein LOC107812525 [Nicotiana tabacum]XP_016493141.1 PREDICTED: uncharacterized protein LOC107812525 [Nicotiana tabacum]